MKGGIYPDKRRPGTWIVRFPGNIWKRFSDLMEAERFLNMLRYRDDNGGVDPREFKSNKPLGFTTKSNEWLDIRAEKLKSPRDVIRHIRRAQDFFGQQYIKDIRYADIERYIRSLPKGNSDKTKANYLATLHSFWQWLVKCQEVPIDQINTFPEISYTLNWRNTIGKDVQQEIIAEVKRISYHINPKIHLGIKWLSTYVSIRPKEMRHIKEGDFDFDLGTVNIKTNKEEKTKIVPLLPEDLDIVKSFPPALPHLYFFRHGVRKGVARKNRGQFGKDYFYKWWKEACRNLGVENVDMYGGTRHSSVKALRKTHRPDEIKQGTMHHTNTAFERYYQIELEDARRIYRETVGNELATATRSNRKAQVIDLFRK